MKISCLTFLLLINFIHLPAWSQTNEPDLLKQKKDEYLKIYNEFQAEVTKQLLAAEESANNDSLTWVDATEGAVSAAVALLIFKKKPGLSKLKKLGVFLASSLGVNFTHRQIKNISEHYKNISQEEKIQKMIEKIGKLEEEIQILTQKSITDNKIIPSEQPTESESSSAQ